MSAAVDYALGEVQQLGRAFRLVGVMPGLVLVLWIYVVVAARTPEGTFDLAGIGEAARGLDLTGGVLLIAAGVGIAFLLQPLQFGTVQLLEGYWGAGPLGHAARYIKIRRNVRRWAALADQLNPRPKRPDVVERVGGVPVVVRWPDDPNGASSPSVDEAALEWIVLSDELRRERSKLPRPHRMLPTRLGNILRSHEDRAGRTWHLPALAILPHVALSAPQRDLDYLHDRRNEMDTAVRFTLVWSVATLVTAGAYWSGGWSALIAAVPWTLVVLSYRGAVAAADHYGNAIALIIDLNRRALYERLGISAPANLNDERTRNTKLVKVLIEPSAKIDLDY